MAFSGNCGLEISLDSETTPLETLFSEELGYVAACKPESAPHVLELLRRADVPAAPIGHALVEKQVRVRCNGEAVLDESMLLLRQWWEETSYQLECLQMDKGCAEQEKSNSFDRQGPSYNLSFVPEPAGSDLLARTDKPRVAILRDEGSNSDREMTSAFYAAGFEPWDICMKDLLEERISLEEFRGIAAVGGFSYADVPESAKGWAATIVFNDMLKKQFDTFYRREDTFSLGVCNGCQLFGLIGWVPWQGIEPQQQPRFVRNTSGRFESRWSTVKVNRSPALMLKNMEELVFGIHVDHGEGRLHFPDEGLHEEVLRQDLAPLVFVDDDGNATESYPFNPNGSPGGLAGLCSPDGRHLAMMPHPERVFLPWQAHWLPEDMKGLEVTPWMQMFRNAYEWCVK
jgi:phosphoribosylformylglycinamidine synthase